MDWNLALKKSISTMFSSDAQLPGAGGGTKMTGEDHINAMLYQKLIHEEKRTDVLLLPLLDNRLSEKAIVLPTTTRYVVMSLSVNNNIHNTSIVLDRQSKIYYYFDSLGGSCPQNFIQHLKDKNLLDESWTKAVSTCPQQTDGWSCGFHAIANVLSCIHGTTEEEKTHVQHEQNGERLRTTLAPLFSNFVRANCQDNLMSQEISKNRKVSLKYALSSIIGENSHFSSDGRGGAIPPDHPDVQRHVLGTLYRELASNVHPDSLKGYVSLEEFAQEFSEKYKTDPTQKEALRLLQQAFPGGHIYQALPSRVGNEAAENAKIRTLIQFIRADQTH